MAIERVNLTFDDKQSTKAASGGAMSADGRYVVFISADKEILGGPERGSEVYLRDMDTGETTLISKGYNGDAIGDMVGVGISGDGRYVVYGSSADNIVEGDSDGKGDVFVYDRQTGVTKMVSDSVEHHTYFDGGVSTNGAAVGFYVDRSSTDDLVVVKDPRTGATLWTSDIPADRTLVSNFTSLRTVGNAWKDFQPGDQPPVLGGRYITSYASSGATLGGYGFYSGWLHDGRFNTKQSIAARGAGDQGAIITWLLDPSAAQVVSVSGSGFEGRELRGALQSTPARQRVSNVAISDDGRHAAFAANYDFELRKPLDGWALYSWDTTTGAQPGRPAEEGGAPRLTKLAFIASVSASSPFWDVRMSANGHFVTFLTDAPMVEGDTNGLGDIFHVENPLWDGTPGEEDPNEPEDWIMGTANDDVLLGTAADDRMDALAGDDDVEGGAGDDEIYGREGDDQIWGGAGDDEIEGGDGKDVICGDYGDNAEVGGDDVIHGGDGDDIIHGESGDDKLWGDDGDDELYGEDGKDVLDGGDGDDELRGGDGDDILTGGAGSDMIVGGDDPQGQDKDVALYEGSAADYTFLDTFSPQREDYTTTVTSKDGDDVDTVIGVEVARFEQLGDNAVDSQTAILTFAQAANAAYNNTANLGHGWRPLSALELGIRSVGEFGDNIYTYKNGAYSALADTSIPGVDPVVEAAAQVYYGVVDGKKTLMLAFRGTDEGGDVGDYPKFALHYARFEPLLKAVLAYVADHGHTTGGDDIDQIMVTGHSLGGAMVQMFMQDDRVYGNDLYTAMTFGSPGAERRDRDDRITHVEHSADLVPLSGDAARLGAALVFPALSQLLERIGDNATAFRTSGGVIRVSLQEPADPLSQHSMDHYHDTAARIDDQAELLAKLGYTGAPGSVFNLVVGSRGEDRLEGANPLLPKVLRGLDYFDGAEVFLSGEGADMIRGGAGGDIFAGYAADLEGDIIEDFAEGDAIKIFDYAGPETVVYNRYVHGTGEFRVLEVGSTTLFLGGYQPGTFKIAVDAQGVATVTYQGVFSFDGGDDADDIAGGEGADQLSGGGGDDQLSGGGGDDELVGGTGSDRLQGGEGNDRLYGDDKPADGLRAAAPAERAMAAAAADIDTAVYDSARTHYRVETLEDGSVRITDLRSGSPDGTDILHDFDTYEFAGKAYTLAELMNPTPPPGGGGGGDPDPGPQDPQPNPGQTPGGGALTSGQLGDYFLKASLGLSPDAATTTLLADLAAQTQRGTLSAAAAMAQVAALQDKGAAVALQTYQFFTGKTPGAAGLAWLVHSPDNDKDLSDAYYAGFNQESRYINFAVNLGLDNPQARSAFSETFGSLSQSDFIKAAYQKIIGLPQAVAHGVDVDAAVGYFGRADNIAFLTQLAQERAVDAQSRDLFVKAALAGQIMSVGAGTTWGVYSAGGDKYLFEVMLGHGQADPVDLVGYGIYQTTPAEAGMM